MGGSGPRVARPRVGWGDAIYTSQQPSGRLRHHHAGRARVEEAYQDRPLARGRILWNCVERRHDGHGQGVHEVEDEVPVLATPDAVLVLNRHRAYARTVQAAGNLEVIGQDIAPDPVAHLRRVHIRISGRVKYRDLVVTGRVRQVAGEGGDPATARRVVATKTVLPAMAPAPHR